VEYDSALVAAIEAELLRRGGRRVGAEIVFRCPTPEHVDKHPSAWWNGEKAAWLCRSCGAKGGAVELARLIGSDITAYRASARVVACYDYRDERGNLLYQVERLEPKSFRQRRPRGAGGWTYRLGEVRRVLYRLPELLAADPIAPVFVVEGEKDADRLASIGLVATTNAGGAGKWRDSYSKALSARNVLLLADNDDPGRKHAEVVAQSIRGVSASVKPLELPGLPAKGDVSDWLDAGGTSAELLKLAAEASTWEPLAATPRSSARDYLSPWARAVSLEQLLAEAESEIEWTASGFAAPSVVVGIASPRGLGKSHVAYALAIAVATGGEFLGEPVRQGRVLLIDRDNPKREVRRRLREWSRGREIPENALRFLSREDAPPLTDADAWADFPFDEYDLVIIDSLGAFTEGVEENRGGQSSAALAPLIDLARRGPAVLVLLNTDKSGTKYRGSGTIGDRLDVLYEARDVTDLAPSTESPAWWSKLAEAGEAAWQERAVRRKRREKVRLALVPSKFRIGEEPDPLAVEIHFDPEGWTLSDVTAELEDAHSGQREAAQKAREKTFTEACDGLARLVAERDLAGDPMRSSDGEAWLRQKPRGLTQRHARATVKNCPGGLWRLERGRGKGAPVFLRPPCDTGPLTTKIEGPESPSGSTPGEGTISVALEPQGRRKCDPLSPLGEKGQRDAPFSSSAGSNQAEDTDLDGVDVVGDGIEL
jgi:hypothetical protein